jgi:DNA polymerase (family 10)
MARRNEDVARLLENIAELLSVTGENPFRVRAYTEAARTISAMSEDVSDLHRSGHLTDVPGVGPSIAAKVGEYLETGRSSYYEGLKRRVPAAVAELLAVPNVGPVRAQRLYQELGITSVTDLARAAREHKLCQLAGFGEQLEQKIGREATRVSQRSRRMLLGVALPAAEEVVALLRRCPAVRDIHAAGSIRRMKETVGDIDILVSSDEPDAVTQAFTSLPIVNEVLAAGPTRSSILTTDGLQVDLRVLRPDSYGAGLQYFTGSKEHNIALRSLAIERGWKLSEYGLFDGSSARIAGETEEGIYNALGMDWIPPELRENRGELDAALKHQLPNLITVEALRGDLHAHTDWSDGHDSPERLVEAAIAKGYQYLALTDHSHSLRVAHGLTVERVREQRAVIDRLNTRYAPFRVLHGTEVEILPDGELDYADEVLAAFDIVTASVHRALGQPRARITARIIRALSNPHVDVLNHPSGRLLHSRSGSSVDMEAVVRAAVANGVALEINGQPERLDLSDVWARYAQAHGALLVCTSDAHSARQLDFVRYAVAVARRGWVEPATVLNCRPLPDLLAHLTRPRPASRPP